MPKKVSKIPTVGPQDPKKKNSPIWPEHLATTQPVITGIKWGCYWNDDKYSPDEEIYSGGKRYRCRCLRNKPYWYKIGSR